MTQEISRRNLMIGGAMAAPLATVAFTATRSEAAGTLAGKSILITGAASGFGHLGALHYARLGAKVIATMRNMRAPRLRRSKTPHATTSSTFTSPKSMCSAMPA